MWYKLGLLWGMLLCSIRPSNGQAELSLGLNAARIYAHTREVRHLAVSFPYGVQLNYAPRAWAGFAGARRYKALQFHISAGWLDFGQPKVLGHAFYTMLGLSNQSLRWGRLTLRYRLGAGGALLTRPFDLETNPTNNVIGGPFTFALQATGQTRFRLGYGLYAFAELGLTHFSNGASRLPNLGLNLLYNGLGIAYAPAEVAETARADAPEAHAYHRWRLYAQAAAAPRQAPLAGAPTRLAAGISLGTEYRIATSSALTAGIDGIYMGTLTDDRVQFDLLPGPNYRVGLWVGHEWRVASLSIATQVGGYVFNPVTVSSKPIYQRYGLRFLAYKALSPGVFVRAHLGKADALEFALRYTFWHSKS